MLDKSPGKKQALGLQQQAVDLGLAAAATVVVATTIVVVVVVVVAIVALAIVATGAAGAQTQFGGLQMWSQTRDRNWHSHGFSSVTDPQFAVVLIVHTTSR